MKLQQLEEILKRIHSHPLRTFLLIVLLICSYIIAIWISSFFTEKARQFATKVPEKNKQRAEEIKRESEIDVPLEYPGGVRAVRKEKIEIIIQALYNKFNTRINKRDEERNKVVMLYEDFFSKNDDCDNNTYNYFQEFVKRLAGRKIKFYLKSLNNLSDDRMEIEGRYIVEGEFEHESRSFTQKFVLFDENEWRFCGWLKI